MTIGIPPRSARARMRPRRLIVWALVILQIAIPIIMFIVRWKDPSVGVLPFGWQVHTNCWGSDVC